MSEPSASSPGPSTRSASDASAPQAEVLHAKAFGLATEQSGVPLISDVIIRNPGPEPLRGLSLDVELPLELGGELTRKVANVPGRGEMRTGPIEHGVAPGLLAKLSASTRATIRWQLKCLDQVIVRGEFGLDLLAWDEWPGLRVPPGVLAPFVTPDHPAVGRVAKAAAERYQASSGQAWAGYEQRSAARVQALFEAIHDSLREIQAAPVPLRPAYEQQGMRVRLADTIERDRAATPLDLALLLAGCAESLGLLPLVVLLDGHALAGGWLVDDRFPEGVVEDAARLRNLVALGNLILIDPSAATSSSPGSLSEAMKSASARMAVDASFLCALDVRVMRDNGYRPLGASAMPRAAMPAPAAASAASPKAASATPVQDRFHKWKERLLDLTLRNKLLNFKPDAKGSLAIDVPDLPVFEDLLAAQDGFELVGKADETPGRKVQADDPGLRERRLADLRNHTLHCGLPEASLWDRCQKIERAARTDLEEGGANTLFATVGLLRWYETAEAQEGRLAPLLLYPVKLTLDRRRKRVVLARLADEPVLNVTLIEKLRRDHGLDLSALASIEPDESGLNVAAMLAMVREGIARMPRWEVVEACYLGSFTFTRFLMWKDLEDNAQAFLRNEVTRHIATGEGGFLGKGREVPIESLDAEVPASSLPCVVDADSTQMSAVASALTGRSFVLQGPPGTGKSQTITNLIAAALASGRTVLFVSEKMAALEVVHRRLQSVGLGDFCLELHSAKANKKQVLESLGQSLQRADRVAAFPWEDRCRELGAARASLDAYPSALHVKRPIGLSFYQASSRLLSMHDGPQLRLTIPHIDRVQEEQLREWQEAVASFAARAAEVEPVASHPWRLSAVAEWSAASQESLGSTMDATIAALDALESAALALASSIGVPVPAQTAALDDLAFFAWALAEGPVPPAAFDAAAWPNIAGRIGQYTAAQRASQARQSELAVRWSPSLYRLDLPTLHSRFLKWAQAFFLFAWWFLRSARKALRPVAVRGLPTDQEITSDLALARSVQSEAATLDQERDWAERVFQGIWSSRSNPLDVLEAALGRAGAVHDAVIRLRARGFMSLQGAMSFAGPATSAAQRAAVQAQQKALVDCVRELDECEQRLLAAVGLQPGSAWPARVDPRCRPALREVLTTWRANLPLLRPWCMYQRASSHLASHGLSMVVDAHRTGAAQASTLVKGFEWSVLDRWVTTVRDREALLRDFDGAAHHHLVKRFSELDRAHIELSRQQVVRSLEQRLPAAGASAASSQQGVLERELRKKTRHMAIRKLLQAIPDLLPCIKPCLLMSPLSVAQYLPADGRPFDLVVFDEASQIGTHDAIGAIARGSQVVIVGDSKQLPPTSFFKRAADDEETAPDDNDVEELESILEEALARQIPQQMLGWHYRSRHDALIDFSNRHYYGGRLHVFPAARQSVPDLGVKFHLVPEGVYIGGDKGKFARTNPKEAEALVQHLVEELRSREPQDRSFGVVTFSMPQQALIQDLLDERRAQMPEIEKHFSGVEPVFVKNLENVQGDERDEILFSIGYARDERGRLRMHFGPLSIAGGERRLNVAVTRARRQLRVFSTLTYDQIDTARTSAIGAAHLRDFLEYAARFGQAAASIRVQEHDHPSEFEREIAQALTGLGHRVDSQVGCGGYRIDLAVAHPTEPGVYVLGVECDGPNYHAAKTARDRDRLRGQVLESLGWRMLRVWSSDWLFDPQAQIERINKAIEEALRKA
ncbi:MAG: DUF4011 domain-containing protein [Deltaproteobacteria bacterium]|nr:DUF4011 domain-containing protein [Deltaproteobacteria bacterium]